MDVTTRYFSEAGFPLLTAPQVARLYGIGTRTVYQWRRRGYLTLAGLDEQGRQLYDTAAVARVKSSPRRRHAEGCVIVLTGQGARGRLDVVTTSNLRTAMSTGNAIIHGYSLADIDSLARSVVLNGRTWWPAGDRDEQYATAWAAIAEHLCAAPAAPLRRDLLEAGRRAVATEVRDQQRHHGTRTDGTNTGAAFARYWEWHSAVDPSPETAVTDRMATRQILAALTGRQQQAIAALAVTGDYHLAAGVLQVTPQSFQHLLDRSRREFRALWHEGETPSRTWGCDRRVHRRETDDPDVLARRARYVEQKQEQRRNGEMPGASRRRALR